ncbi:lysozyme inhibitor LprI family protein [Pseudomonas helleri]|uniref:lysozyme inhibitor LprI family protein n=1 Tax=Pseudomonas helleri TaxID=1608996 RepID=UPI003FD408BB
MRLYFGSLCMALAWALAFTPPAGATSFDCKKAVTFSELQICGSQSLQLQDEKLNTAYVQALGNSADKTRLRSEQRAWIKQRDLCESLECVSQSLEGRIKVLTDSSGPQPPTSIPMASSIQSQPSTKNAHQISPILGGSTETKRALQPSVNPESPRGAGSSTETIDTRTLKIGAVGMAFLLLICIWLHSRGSMVIYSCYTDALWTILTPFVSVGSYFLASWLEFSQSTSFITAAVVAGLMSLQIIIQTFRSNGFSLFFLLALYAKIILFSIYFLSIGALILGGGRTASDRRRRRNWALAGSVLFAVLTGWMCRNRQFSHIDDYIAGRT